MKILIGSIFSNDSDFQRKWYDLQQFFLKKTTFCDFDHIVFSSEGYSDYYAEQSTVIVPQDTSFRYGQAHQMGLEALVDHFVQQADNYDCFLILDSDAFPVRENWADLLLDKMGDREVALPVRVENLELRLHASVLFAKKEALPYLKFDKGYLGPNLNGEDEHDIHLPYYQHEARDKAFALIRSNNYNVHPLIAGVYYDCFYHHGCGSRHFYMTSAKYWDHVSSVEDQIENLMSNPEDFIRKLRHGKNLFDNV